MPGHRTQREGARARKPELRNHKQASRVRKYPGARQRRRRRPKGYTHTRGLPSAARLMPGHRTQREGARARKPELRNHKQASRARKCPGAGQLRRHPRGYTHTRGLPSAARLMPGHRTQREGARAGKHELRKNNPALVKNCVHPLLKIHSCPFVSIRGSKRSPRRDFIRGSKQPRFRQSLRDVAWNFPEFLT